MISIAKVRNLHDVGEALSQINKLKTQISKDGDKVELGNPLPKQDVLRQWISLACGIERWKLQQLLAFFAMQQGELSLVEKEPFELALRPNFSMKRMSGGSEYQFSIQEGDIVYWSIGSNRGVSDWGQFTYIVDSDLKVIIIASRISKAPAAKVIRLRITRKVLDTRVRVSISLPVTVQTL